MAYQVTSGRSYPLGAKVLPDGINFALFSTNATKVELCLFDNTGTKEVKRVELPEFTDDIWHGHIADLPAGTLYGYRVYGPYEPHNGHRFNPNKLLIDPYAKKLFGEFIQSDTHYAYDLDSRQRDLTFDIRDNAKYMPKCVAINDLEKCTTHPQVRRRDTMFYEMHPKGFTQNHPDVPKNIRGTFSGLADKSICDYLVDLGITSVELLPVHTFFDEPFLTEKNLTNYWGYNSIGFFIPNAKYCHEDDINDFKKLIETYHAAGIEVILDVVYNHTAEGSELGPTISFKGIDNASYYRLAPEHKRYYVNYSGCGNTLNISHPRVLQMVTDSLRYWVEIMGVDGFRFDLAPILGRGETHFSENNHFFSALRQDPILSRVKLIAEPWDIGVDGYQLGRFPNSWLEWNDRFRDTVRRFWRGDEGLAPEFAKRLHGSADIFAKPSRRPSASVNLITTHDGFTLHDLVSYEDRHNQLNGENNRDGHGANFSCNFGFEGETDNLVINQLRLQQKRNLLATLFLSQGTPLLLAGDEFNNSQDGNNNAYCQDNDISWLDWHRVEENDLLPFVKHLIKLRKKHPLLNRMNYQHGLTTSDKTGLPDISWLSCKGKLMNEKDWHNSSIKCFAMLLADTDYNKPTEVLHEHDDDALLVIFNAHGTTINYQLPELKGTWQVLINTAEFTAATAINNNNKLKNNNYILSAHSCVVLSYSQNTATTTNEE
ncbi:MAG: glycogen debranching protein GlgX [Thalassotalea sp.]